MHWRTVVVDRQAQRLQELETLPHCPALLCVRPHTESHTRKPCLRFRNTSIVVFSQSPPKTKNTSLTANDMPRLQNLPNSDTTKPTVQWWNVSTSRQQSVVIRKTMNRSNHFMFCSHWEMSCSPTKFDVFMCGDNVRVVDAQVHASSYSSPVSDLTTPKTASKHQ